MKRHTGTLVFNRPRPWTTTKIILLILLLFLSAYQIFPGILPAKELGQSSIFDNTPEHQAIVRMLKAEGKNTILHTAFRVGLHGSGDIAKADFATATIGHQENGKTVRSKFYLFKENGQWTAFLDLPTHKDHRGVIMTLARRHCASSYELFKGFSFEDDSWQNTDLARRTINVDCMELIGKEWRDNRLSLVFEYDKTEGWKITGSSMYQRPSTVSKKKLSTAKKKRSSKKPKEPTSIQQIFAQSDLQVAIAISYSIGETRALELIRDGADVHYRDKQQYTPLHTAMQGRPPSKQIVQALIKGGAEVNAVEKWGGYTPLHLLAGVARDEYVVVAKILIGAGADVNLRSSSGDTPLHQMTYHGQGCKGLAMAKLLIKAGADVYAKNNYDQAVLDLAHKYNCTELVKLLKEKGGQ